MEKFNFKVGDKVFIKCVRNDGSIELTREHIGKVGKIISILENKELEYRVKFKIEEEYFFEDELILVTNVNKKTLKVLYAKS